MPKSNVEFDLLFRTLFNKPIDVGRFTSTMQDDAYEYEFTCRVTKRIKHEDLAHHTEDTYTYLANLNYWPLDHCEENTNKKRFGAGRQCSNPATRVVIYRGFLTGRLQRRFCCAVHAEKRRESCQIEAVVELVDTERLRVIKKVVMQRAAANKEKRL